MKKLLLLFFLITASKAAQADIVETPTGSPVSDLLLLVGVVAIAALLFMRYRRTRHKQ